MNNMHSDFAEWYRAAGIQPSSTELPQRWAAVESFGVHTTELTDAARLFYGLLPNDSTFSQQLRMTLQKADPAVPMSGNEREIAVIAGAVLADSIERCESPIAIYAALATVCPAAKNLRKSPIVPAIPELASNKLALWSSERTKGGSNGAVTTEKPLPAKGAEDIRTHCKGGDVTALAEPLARLHLAVGKLQKNPTDFKRQLALQAEETNMLWWLIGEHSRDLKKPFCELPAEAACLIAGKELADLTRELPGPVAGVAFLDRVIRSNRKKTPASVTIESAVNNTPREWRQKLLGRSGVDNVGNLAPVMEAIRASLRVEDGENWSAIYSHAAGISASAKLSPADLTDQFYQENLLIQAWNLSSSLTA